MSDRCNPDLANDQYHAICDMMWAALGRSKLKVDEPSVFHAVAGRIRELEGTVERIRAECEDEVNKYGDSAMPRILRILRILDGKEVGDE